MLPVTPVFQEIFAPSVFLHIFCYILSEICVFRELYRRVVGGGGDIRLHSYEHLIKCLQIQM